MTHEETVIATGRRAKDGKIRLSVFTNDLLAMSIDAGGERAATLLLTHEQAIELQRTLGVLVSAIHEPEANAEAWAGAERRHD